MLFLFTKIICCMVIHLTKYKSMYLILGKASWVWLADRQFLVIVFLCQSVPQWLNSHTCLAIVLYMSIFWLSVFPLRCCCCWLLLTILAFHLNLGFLLYLQIINRYNYGALCAIMHWLLYIVYCIVYCIRRLYLQ